MQAAMLTAVEGEKGDGVATKAIMESQREATRRERKGTAMVGGCMAAGDDAATVIALEAATMAEGIYCNHWERRRERWLLLMIEGCDWEQLEWKAAAVSWLRVRK
ncbi:hypothetical protein BHE74_00009026 [Ensete ventricosum]|nr:hypothetical protein BHE74_00009026 [Ensete ventricosum]